MRRLLQVLIALDQLANAFLAGWADETLSSRAYRNDSLAGKRRWRIARRVIDGLFFWEPGHCHKAFIAEINRRQLPPAMRQEERTEPC